MTKQLPTPDEGQPFDVMLAALRAGDNDAWRQVMERYSACLIAMARSRLSERLRQKVDCADVVQSVYRTVYRRLAAGQFQFDSWDSLLGMLIVLTARRCCRWFAHYQTQARDLGREVTLQAGEQQTGPAPLPAEPADRQPTPEEAAMLEETIRQTLGSLDAQERQAVLLGLLGDSDAEIGRQVGLTQYTVRQIRRQYRARLQELHEGGPEPAA